MSSRFALIQIFILVALAAAGVRSTKWVGTSPTDDPVLTITSSNGTSAFYSSYQWWTAIVTSDSQIVTAEIVSTLPVQLKAPDPIRSASVDFVGGGSLFGKIVFCNNSFNDGQYSWGIPQLSIAVQSQGAKGLITCAVGDTLVGLNSISYTMDSSMPVVITTRSVCEQMEQWLLQNETLIATFLPASEEVQKAHRTYVTTFIALVVYVGSLYTLGGVWAVVCCVIRLKYYDFCNKKLLPIHIALIAIVLNGIIRPSYIFYDYRGYQGHLSKIGYSIWDTIGQFLEFLVYTLFLMFWAEFVFYGNRILNRKRLRITGLVLNSILFIIIIITAIVDSLGNGSTLAISTTLLVICVFILTILFFCVGGKLVYSLYKVKVTFGGNDKALKKEKEQRLIRLTVFLSVSSVCGLVLVFVLLAGGLTKVFDGTLNASWVNYSLEFILFISPLPFFTAANKKERSGETSRTGATTTPGTNDKKTVAASVS